MRDSFWDDYDLFVENIRSSSYKLFPNNLKRWLALLEADPDVGPVTSSLEADFDFANWYKTGEKTMSSMVGSASLEWPIETKARLGAQLSLMRAFSTHQIEIWNFASTFMGDPGDFDQTTYAIVSEFFQPLQRELRGYLQRALTPPASNPLRSAPAADRTVRLDHNSTAYAEAIDALNKVRDAVAASNDYYDQDDKGQRLAELEASKDLLKGPRVSVTVFQAVTVGCLKYLGERFVEGIIGTLVTTAIVALAALVGIHLLA
jgi:hypothetical protein